MSNQEDLAELWALALDRGYVYGEIENPTGEEFYGDGPIVLFDLACRAVVGFGMTAAQAIVYIQESSGPARGDR